MLNLLIAAHSAVPAGSFAAVLASSGSLQNLSIEKLSFGGGEFGFRQH